VGVPGFLRRVFGRYAHRQGIGHIVITLHHPGGTASITVSPSVHAFPRPDWHWLYLQHLAETLCAIADEGEALRLVVAARTLAQDVLDSSRWKMMSGQAIPGAMAGVPKIVPEQPGGEALTVEVVRRHGEMPTLRLRWPPSALKHLASSNLVLLLHTMEGATHPLEQYELFKKIAVLAGYYEKTGCYRDPVSLRNGPLYAVIHADITRIVDIGSRPDAVRVTSAPQSTVAVPAPAQRRLRLPARLVSDAAVFVVALITSSALFVVSERLQQSLEVKAPRGTVVDPAFVPAGPQLENPRLTPVPLTARAGRSPERPMVRSGIPKLLAPSPGSSGERPRQGDVLPRFRVVSGTLARDVAEHRSRVLAERGVDSFMLVISDNIAQLQYGAYRVRENAEADARRIRTQGYTATVVPSW
jgi:hypothetical protein